MNPQPSTSLQSRAGLPLLLLGLALTLLWGGMALKLVRMPLLVHSYLDWVVVLSMVLMLAGAGLLFFKAHRGRKVAKRMRLDAHRRSRALFSEKSRLYKERVEGSSSRTGLPAPDGKFTPPSP
jgi:hypothetical protein